MIKWKGNYRIDGEAFVYIGRDVALIVTILGYAASFCWFSVQIVFGWTGRYPYEGNRLIRDHKVLYGTPRDFKYVWLDP